MVPFITKRTKKTANWLQLNDRVHKNWFFGDTHNYLHDEEHWDRLSRHHEQLLARRRGRGVGVGHHELVVGEEVVVGRLDRRTM